MLCGKIIFCSNIRDIVQVTNSQKFMSVVNQRGRVLLFRLSKQQESQQSEKVSPSILISRVLLLLFVASVSRNYFKRN